MTMLYVWAAVIAVSLIVEFVTQEVVSIWFAGGGLVSLILAACGASLAWQIPVFVVVSIVLVISTRPLIKKFIKKDTVPTNADALIGYQGKLLSDVTEDKNGTLKIKGVVWSAKSSEALSTGTKVEVVEINGNTLTVKKI